MIDDLDVTSGDEGTQEDDRNYEAEALEIGWIPKEKFKGDKEWIPAKEFIERGEHILPIIKANSRKLQKELLTSRQTIDKLTADVATARKTLDTLRKHYDEDTKAQVENAKKELIEELKQAKKDGDVDAEVDVQEKLDNLRQSQRQVEQEVREDKVTPKQELHPDFIAWQKENPWFGNGASPDDLARSNKFIQIAQELRRDGDMELGAPFIKRCVHILEEREGERKISKVEGGTVRGKGGSTRKFDRLPKEAKEACHEDNDRFVGPGKKFKHIKEWEDEFATLYGED